MPSPSNRYLVNGDVCDRGENDASSACLGFRGSVMDMELVTAR